MINGSPKRKKSASECLLRELKSYLKETAEMKDFYFHQPQPEASVLQELKHYDALVFAFPLYVDGIPSHMLSCLCQMEKTGMDNQNMRVFGIINSGFFEGHQNAIAMDILKNWCRKTGLSWGMGIGFGGGGAMSHMEGVPRGQGPKRSLDMAFIALRDRMEKQSAGEDLYISPGFPRWIYKWAAEMGWRKAIRKNGGRIKDLGRR